MNIKIKKISLFLILYIIIQILLLLVEILFLLVGMLFTVEFDGEEIVWYATFKNFIPLVLYPLVLLVTNFISIIYSIKILKNKKASKNDTILSLLHLPFVFAYIACILMSLFIVG